MNRTRNIIIWIITAIFFAGAMFFVAVMNLGIMLAIALPAVIIATLLFVLIPNKMGVAKPAGTQEDSFSELVLPAIFQVELRLESMNLPKVIRIPIDKSEFTIGRSKACDFSMEENKRLSSRHVTIRFNPKDHSYSIEDHNTTNGTLLNREPLIPGKAIAIQKNDILELPGVMFKVRSAYS